MRSSNSGMESDQKREYKKEITIKKETKQGNGKGAKREGKEGGKLVRGVKEG